MWMKVKNNTILFVIILLFIHFFAFCFGKENNIVGVTTIITILMVMNRKKIAKPKEYFLKLLCLNIVLGIFASFSNTNSILGFFLNFVILLILAYTLSDNHSKGMIVPFGLQYLFMLYAPVTGQQYIYRIIGLAFASVLIVSIQLITFKKSNLDDSLKSNILHKASEHRKEYSLLGLKIHLNKLRLNYAFRMAIAVALSAFLVDAYNIFNGRWVVYTVFSLTEFHHASCLNRSIQRLKGTILGIIIVIFFWGLIEDNNLRSFLVLIGGYCDTYTSNYKDKMICVTVSVVASSSLGNNLYLISFERILYVFIGYICVWFFSKVVVDKSIMLQT